MCAGENGKRFMLWYPTRDMDDLRAAAALAAKLKPYGEVLVSVGTLAEKAFHEIPEGGSPWHEYTVCQPALNKIFPHAKIAAHVPEDFVKKNQALIRAQGDVLREAGLSAWMLGQEPYFMPESFFEEHPHLRGPRIDHPRRARREEFAMCTDLDEVREMYVWMMAELKRNVPALKLYAFNTNDAGSGFCWAEWLYSGPNGPQACRGKTAGKRIREFCEVLHRGAEAGGGDVSVFIAHINLKPNERLDVLNNLPPNTALRGSDSETAGVGTYLRLSNPVLGLVTPLGVVAGMERIVRDGVRNIFVGLGAPYYRCTEHGETVARIIEIVGACLQKPPKGLRSRLDLLHELAVGWAGPERADELTEALYDLDECLHAKEAIVRRYSTMYCGISMRHLTRPLVFDPRLLTPGEEDTWLPHVFNIRESEARTDTIDLHGGRMRVGTGKSWGIPALTRVLDRLQTVAATLEDMKDAPAGAWLFDLGTSVRIYVSIVRTIDNFYFGQLIRDRSVDALSREEPVVPEKTGSWEGEGEILAWNERMRDEFDNTNELIALLEERGLGQLAHAEDERDEDTFLLGPNVLDHLKKKVRVMRDHWLDVERYLAPPHK